MANAKARIDYSGEPDGGLSGPAHNVHDNMVANAATFASPPITMAAFKTMIDDWDTALGESLKGGSDRTTIKNNARAALEDTLAQLGAYVNLVAKGDQATVDLSGFPSYVTGHAISGSGVTFIPQNVRWEDGTIPGQQVMRWKGDGSHSTYEVQTCSGDPNVETNWTYKGSFSGGRAVLNGNTPGSKIWGRVRKIGTGGQVGDWSDPAQAMVT
jgi:hypothetical protein